MQKSNRISGLVAALAIVLAGTLWAGMPLNSLDGCGGFVFNPLAYTGGHLLEGGPEWVTMPQVGAWYLKLPASDVSWQSYSLSLTALDRIELSYAANLVNARKAGDSSILAHRVGAKLRLLDENLGDHAWVPAIAAGAVFRYTDSETTDLVGLDKSGFEYYIVASKLITQTPLAVMLSAGLQMSNEVAYGVFGHNDYGMGFFANADIFPIQYVAVGVEFRQGIKVGKIDASDGKDIKNADYWDAHLAWFIDEQLTFVAAYVYTGERDKSLDRLGLGHGFLISGQYQF